MATRRRTLPEEEAVVLFSNVMKRRQLRSDNIRRGREKEDIYGIGEYSCKDCENVWTSHFSWITVDLKEKRICKRWTMKCKECLLPYMPYFDLDSIDRMIQIAVERYKGEYVSRRPNKPFEKRPDPHRSELCEKCGWGAKKCWEHYYYPR